LLLISDDLMIAIVPDVFAAVLLDTVGIALDRKVDDGSSKLFI